jgi:putative ABC transport system ATP-binding protein
MGSASEGAGAGARRSEPLIELHDVRHVYSDGGVEVAALRGVSLTIASGEFVAIVGQSGSGKSTLLHLMGAMDRPASGKILLRGRDLALLDDEARTAVRRREVGFVFQFFNLLPTLDLAENVMLPALLAGTKALEARRRAEELLAAVGLAALSARRVSGLSGGERQRGAIARALINDPALLLADEPTGNLDTVTGGEIVRLLRSLPSARGTAVVLATHARDLIAASDRVLALRDGMIEWPSSSASSSTPSPASSPPSPASFPRSPANPP